jgi:phenylalanyl-tRNA synthetase beta chain
MELRITDSHLREYLHTSATPEEIARELSLRSASVDSIETTDTDTIYTLEITTNRVDMMGVIGVAREAHAALTAAGIEATLHAPRYPALRLPESAPQIRFDLDDNAKVRRICAVEMHIDPKRTTPEWMITRLEAAGIRPLHPVVDITNYVMLTIGHPTHACDMDRLDTTALRVGISRPGERVITLDGKERMLGDEDIVLTDEKGRTVDLVGIMGLENSAIQSNTARVVYFVDNNDPWTIRTTSMQLQLRTDAAVLNEKDVDPELAMEALNLGISLMIQHLDAKPTSMITDIYPGREKVRLLRTIEVDMQRVEQTIGVTVDPDKANQLLTLLGYQVTHTTHTFTVTVPSYRTHDVIDQADVIEEIARMTGYHTLPNMLPPFTSHPPYIQSQSVFFWEKKLRERLAAWGLTEIYTLSLTDTSDADGIPGYVLSNPLDQEHVYLRQSLLPSLRMACADNAGVDRLRLFEIAHVYPYQRGKLPDERLALALLFRDRKHNDHDRGNSNQKEWFALAKEHLQGILRLMHIDGEQWLPAQDKHGDIVIRIHIKGTDIAEIIRYSDGEVGIEIDLHELISSYAHATIRFNTPQKYPAVEEDITVVTRKHTTLEISQLIAQHSLVQAVSFVGKYGDDTRTYHIHFGREERMITADEVALERQRIIQSLQKAGMLIK